MTCQAAGPVLVHGHRGARALRPENTLPAFEYAIQIGVDVLEMDMAVTKDDVIVISHDSVINPAICTGGGTPRPIRSMTLAELRKWDCGALRNPGYPQQTPVPGTPIPTLDEVLSLADRGTFDFNIETKIEESKPDLAPTPRRFVELMLAIVRKHKLEDRVILQSFDFRTLREMHALEPRIRLSALIKNPFSNWVQIAKDTGATIISPERRITWTSKVKSAHKAGLQVVPWTANQPDEWQSLIKKGVDAIITDDPAGLVAYLKSKGLRK
jgi:glycerophosphoryl diester phosphodiesterase